MIGFFSMTADNLANENILRKVSLKQAVYWQLKMCLIY